VYDLLPRGVSSSLQGLHCKADHEGVNVGRQRRQLLLGLSKLRVRHGVRCPRQGRVVAQQGQDGKKAGAHMGTCKAAAVVRQGPDMQNSRPANQKAIQHPAAQGRTSTGVDHTM